MSELQLAAKLDLEITLLYLSFHLSKSVYRRRLIRLIFGSTHHSAMNKTANPKGFIS